MKLSTRGRYGLRVMVDLALHYNSGCISLKDIALRQELSEKYLEHIVTPLVKGGFVKSVRGAQGGYMLSHNPSEITVGAILRQLEGSLAPVDCIAGDACEREDICVTKIVWKKIKIAIDDVVDNITLADLVNESREMLARAEN